MISYVTDTDGNLLSLPFNSSTPMMWYKNPRWTPRASPCRPPGMRLSKPPARFALPSGTLIDLGQPVAATPGHPVTLGVRPEHLTLDPNGPIHLSVIYHEQLGADTLVHGTLKGTERPLALRLDGTRSFVSGDVLHLGTQTESLHIFDRDTEARLSRGFGETAILMQAE